MYVRTAGALCLWLAAAQGWSQMRPSQVELHLWTDFSSASLTAPDGIGAQRTSGNRAGGANGPSGQRVSVNELRHKVPGKAAAAFARGLKFADVGDFFQAARNFGKAAKIDPKFAAARGNLGVMYLNLRLFDMGVAELRRALQLDPADSFSHANLALGLILLDLPGEAEPEAQTAVALDSSNMKARYLFGLLLARQPATRGKAAEQLTYAAQQLPEAHLALAAMYHQDGSDSLAQVEQERYRKAVLSAIKEP